MKGTQQLIPVEGLCPVCDGKMLWGDVVKEKKAEEGTLHDPGEMDDDECAAEHRGAGDRTMEEEDG